MPGSARSLDISCFSGLRVGWTIYTPAHSKNGKNINAKLDIYAYKNTGRTNADGTKKDNIAIPFTVWGKMADICARSMSEGKEFNCHARLDLYRGRTFYPSAVEGQPGEQVFDKTGQPLMSKKFSFGILNLTFGEESDNHIQMEIDNKFRPFDWNVKGSAGEAAWKQTLDLRKNAQYQPGMVQFGWAKVRQPAGQGIGPYVAEATAPQATPQNTTAAVAATFAGVNPATTTAPVNAPATAPAAGFAMPSGV